MSESNNITELLKNKNFSFTEEELNKIIEVELGKSEEEKNTELIELCQSLINDQKNTQKNNGTKKRKLSFRFISLIVTVAVLLFALVPVFLKFTSPQGNITFPQTENSSVGNITETTSAKATETSTVPVLEPIKTTTEPDTEASVNSLYKPEQILFYHNGKPQTISKDSEMCDTVIRSINKAIANDKWGILKLAVEDGYIDKIKNENLCIEIFYNDTQTLEGFKGHTQDKYHFEKILIILDGVDKNTMFFCKNGVYQHGPVKPFSSDLSEELLKGIFDEQITTP